MYFLFFILGGICGVITTSILAARAINETEKETFDRCLNDAKRSFGRDWKGSEDKTKPIYTHNLAADMIELLENKLDERNAMVPDEERSGDPCEAAIYGTTYDFLLDDIEILLINICEKANVEYVSDVFE